jgi:hypothetical protein
VIILCPLLPGQDKAKPLTKAQVVDLLRNYVPPQRVAEIVRKEGIDFTLGPDDEKRLRRAGADAALIDTLRRLVPQPVRTEDLAPEIYSFTAEPSTLDQGQPSTLRWSVGNATNVTVEPDIGKVDLTGSQLVSPSASRTYTLWARGPGGVQTRTIWLVVRPPSPQPVIETFAADPPRIEIGGQVNLRWSVNNADEIDIQPDIGKVGPNGLRLLYPAATTSYVISARGAGGARSERLTVEVTEPSDPLKLAAMAKESYADKDYVTAAVFFRRAAERGNTEAMTYLGNLLQTGLGVSADPDEARSWYRSAAEAGDRAAMFNLGLIYERGMGTSADRTEAAFWYFRSAQAGSNDARDALKRLGSDYTGSPPSQQQSNVAKVSQSAVPGVCQGVVIDSSGRFVAGAPVWITRQKNKNQREAGGGKNSYHIKADSTGHYYQGGLSSGLYSVRVFTNQGDGEAVCLAR